MNPLLITKSETKPILRMDVAAEIETEIRELFINAAKDFESDIEELINFDPGYQIQEGECFKIDQFPIDNELLAVCKQPLAADRLDVDDLPNIQIKSIVGFDFSDNQNRLYYQNFDTRRILIPGKRFAVWSVADESTFRALDKPIIQLDAQLAAIWDNGTLKFKSFHNAKQIFDLTAYFTEATDDQVAGFVAHELIRCADASKIIKICSTWSRKKIAIILQSGVLNEMTPASIQEAAVLVAYQVPMDDNKILLPTTKAGFKSLLQFLDEDLYTGPISKRRLLSSGKRVLR